MQPAKKFRKASANACLFSIYIINSVFLHIRRIITHSRAGYIGQPKACQIHVHGKVQLIAEECEKTCFVKSREREFLQSPVFFLNFAHFSSRARLFDTSLWTPNCIVRAEKISTLLEFKNKILSKLKRSWKTSECVLRIARQLMAGPNKIEEAFHHLRWLREDHR